MDKFITKASGILVCLLLAGTGLAGSVDKEVNLPEQKQTLKSNLTAGELAEKLSLKYREWVEANLNGAQKESEKLEKSIIQLLNHDMMLSETRVRDLARDAALARVVDEVDQERPTLTEVTEQETAFQQGVAILNTKEALYKTINKSIAFSTKYRLLGDYIDLLRRELQLPRLKLASLASRNVSATGREGR